jgi:tetratricopeptide (TPR) repeat protein
LAVEQSLNRAQLLQHTLQDYSAGDFLKALDGFERLGSSPEDHPQLKLCHAVAAFHVGRLDLVLRLFDQVPPDQWSCYEQEVFLHSRWPNGSPEGLLAEMQSCLWDTPQLQQMRAYLEGRVQPQFQLCDPVDLARDPSQRWIVHPMFRLVAIHRVRLRVFHHPLLKIEAPLAEALAFFQQQLPSCPEFLIQRDALAALAEESSQRPEMNQIGDTLQLLAHQIKPWEYALALSPQSNWALSSGVARHSGRLASLQLGHLEHHQALVMAHELAHLILDLPDLPSQSGYGGEGSLMSSDWDLPLPATHLDLRSKAACLTPLAVHRQVLWGKEAEKSGDFAQALRYYQRGFEQDRWHLALGLAQLRLLKVLKRRKSLERLSDELICRFPLPEIELRILGFLEKAPNAAGQDPAGAARALLAQGRSRLAGSILSSLPPEVRDGPEMLGCRAASLIEHWNPKAACDCLSQALEQAPAHFKLHEMMAHVQLNLGQLDAMRASLKRASQLQGRKTLPKIYRYLLHSAHSEFEKAAIYLKDFLKKQPADETSWNQLGLIQLRHHQDSQAQQSFAKAVGLKATAYNRACLALAQGKLALARQLALQATRQSKYRPPALELLAYLEPEQTSWLDKLYTQIPGYVRTIIR